MAHSLIVGMTESGKSSLAKIIIKGSRKRGIKTAVLDPLQDPSFHADFQTRNPDEFLKWAKSNRSALLFIDEGGQSIGRYNPTMEWLVTTARHLGHSSFVICQGVSQLSPLVRSQCTKCYLFATSQSNIKLIAEDFNHFEILKMQRLNQLECLVVNRYGTLSKIKVDPKNLKISELPLDKQRTTVDDVAFDNVNPVPQ